MKRVGAVIVFNEGATHEQVQRYLRDLTSPLGPEETHKEIIPKNFDVIAIRTFDPVKEGWPVFYIP